MKGIIVVNAYIKNSSQISQAERIEQELCALGCDVEIVKNINLASIIGGKVNAVKADFCVFLDKDKAAARLLERSGLKLFNSAESIEVCDDKMLTHIALSNLGINMPNCMYAPLCYYADAKACDEFLCAVADKLKFPLIAKTCFGSLGAGVTKIDDLSALKNYESKNKLVAHFYQQFIGCGTGEDIRVIVVGGKYVCSMKRTNNSDFRSNIELGGRGENYLADKELIALCERVAKILKLDYCGIDVLTDKSGKRYICEVNSNAFFATAEKVCNVNVAKAYASHIISNVKNK
jgi:ribosomal protein S6--L-glutamate ligase/gamma-F420-2:alpha-L-glutamate ligase